MNEKNSDDIFALCSRFDLDQDSYRVFPKRVQKVSTQAPAEITSIPEAKQAQPALPETMSDLPEPVEQDPSPRLVAEGRAMRADLRNLLKNLGVNKGFERPRNFEELLSTSIFVHAAAGGVGATTVVATLATLLAKEDKHCVVVDGRQNSLMPFFLGGRPVSIEHKGAPGARSLAAASAIRIVTRDPQAATQPTDEGADPAWYRNSVTQLKGAVDHMLVDAQAGSGANLNQGISLIVAIPNANSVAGAVALKQQLTEEAPDSRIVCVLNKFDRSVPLHADMAHWFQENFETVKITRSDLVNEALTEGLTIADWAPDSEVTKDFVRLLSAVKAFSDSSLHSNKEQESQSCR